MLDCIGADSTPVDSAGRRHHLLRTRIDAVLIGKDVDPKSVDEATHLDRGRETDYPAWARKADSSGLSVPPPPPRCKTTVVPREQATP